MGHDVEGDSALWSGTSFHTWTDGQTVSLSLTQSAATVVPTAPMNLTATAGRKRVILKWRNPGNASIQKYQFKQGTGNWTNIDGSHAGTVQHAVTGLTDGTEYAFRIRAVNSVGNGAQSAEVKATPSATAKKPPTPGWISGRKSVNGTVELRWGEDRFFPETMRGVTRAQYRQRRVWSFGGGNVRGSLRIVDIPRADFAVRRDEHGRPYRTHTVEGLTNGRSYMFSVRYWNAGGPGDWSEEVEVSPTGVPENLAVTWTRHPNNAQMCQARLSWTRPRGGGDLLWYDLEVRSGGHNLVPPGPFSAWGGTPSLEIDKGATGYTVPFPVPGAPHVIEFALRSVMDTPGAEHGHRWNQPQAKGKYRCSSSQPVDAPAPGAPVLQWARVNGAELALRFDAELDESSVPAAGAFAVSVAGAARGVSAVAVSLDMVTLTLAQAVSAGDVVSVGYGPPAQGPRLRLPGGGAAVAAFSGAGVTNDTPSEQLAQRSPPGPVEPPAAEPLTASIAAAPSEHKGKGRFEVRVAFSDAVAGRPKDAAVQVTGGTLVRAARADGRADLWALTVRPASHGPVTVTLPATADCAASGAVCTADGRRLEGALAHTVQGPPGLSVADASAQEGAGATVDFAVTLSRAASGEVTVDWRTRDGTAKKGKDYRKAKGTLTFAAGETAKTVSVALLDDAHDEGAETFRLVLSKAKGAAIADGEAVGTITNADPLQKDWLARFGRAAAADAVAAVTARLETPRGAGSHLTLGGHRVDLSGTDGSGALEQALTGFALLLGASPEAADPVGSELPRRWMSDIGPAERPGGEARTIRGRELLMGTSFRAVLGSGAGSQWTSWGQGASVSQFSSAGPSLSLSGETATGSLGMDYERGRLLTGFAMTHSLGEGTAHGAGRSYLMGSSVTTMLPYARLRLTDRVSAWGLAGTGSGRLTLDLDGDAPERYGTDLSMTLAAMGVRGDLVKPAEAGGFALALKADAFWVRTKSDAVSKPGAGNLAGARAEASRLRAVLDGSRSFALAGGAALTPSVELGVRHDGGDAETGTGFELGAGLGYADPSRGLDMALRVHGLAAHAEDGYNEWGVSGSLRLVPGGAGRGLSASLTPSYGVDPGGSERLWMMPDASGLATNDNAPLSSRLDAEVGYGIAMFGGGFTGTPNVGLGLSDTAREVRMGWRLSPADGGDFEVNLDASRRDSAGDAPEHRIGFGVTARW